MSQVQIDFSKIAAQDLSSQARPRSNNLPRTDDFASMLDPGRDATPAPAHVDAAARNDRNNKTAAYRTNSVPPADRPPSGGVARADAGTGIKDNGQPRATDRTGNAKATDTGPALHKRAGAADADKGDGKTEPDNNDTVAATDAAPEVAVASVAPVAQPNALALTETAADDATSVAVTVTVLASVQSGAGDAGAANAGKGEATEAGQSATAALPAALAQIKAGGETVALDDEAAPPGPAEAGAAAVSLSVAEKPAKGDEFRTAGVAKKATAPAGQNATADEQQVQPLLPDAADGAKAQHTTGTVPEDAQARVHAQIHDDNATGTPERKEAGDDGAGIRTNEPRIGALQAAAANSAAPMTSVGAHAGIGAIEGVSAAAASATAAPNASRTDAATTAVPLTDVGVEIATQANAGRRSFDIRLDPPELGHIRVRLDVDRDGNVVSRLVVDRAETLDLLRRDAPQLQRALQDAGLKADAQTMQFSLRNQNGGQQDGQNNQRPTTRTADVDAGARVDEVPTSYGRLVGRTGGLDIRI